MKQEKKVHIQSSTSHHVYDVHRTVCMILTARPLRNLVGRYKIPGTNQVLRYSFLLVVSHHIRIKTCETIQKSKTMPRRKWRSK